MMTEREIVSSLIELSESMKEKAMELMDNSDVKGCLLFNCPLTLVQAETIDMGKDLQKKMKKKFKAKVSKQRNYESDDEVEV